MESSSKELPEIQSGSLIRQIPLTTPTKPTPFAFR